MKLSSAPSCSNTSQLLIGPKSSLVLVSKSLTRTWTASVYRPDESDYNTTSAADSRTTDDASERAAAAFVLTQADPIEDLKEQFEVGSTRVETESGGPIRPRVRAPNPTPATDALAMNSTSLDTPPAA